METNCCDNCIHYHWYYDKCDKWDCSVDAREVHECCEPGEHSEQPPNKTLI